MRSINGSLTKESYFNNLVSDMRLNKYAYFMAIPLVAYYLIFHYGPMYGTIIAFKDYSPGGGIFGSDWVGLEHFVNFFSSEYSFRIIRNTVVISAYSLLFCFPAPILLALLINEIRNDGFKRVVQTASYLPHFISTVVVCGMIVDFASGDGLFNSIFSFMGRSQTSLLVKPELFRTIYIGSELWQQTGWNTILYLAALAAIDPELYDAARIDGAGRIRQIMNVTLPGILPTIVTLFLLRIGQVMNIGFEKIILLYNPLTYETADVISSFVYRKGLLEFNYGYSAAVGLFNSSINFLLLLVANWLSRKLNETSLW